MTFPLYVEVNEIQPRLCCFSRTNPSSSVQTMTSSVHGAINMPGLALRMYVTILEGLDEARFMDRRASTARRLLGHVNSIGPRACYDEGKRCAETLFFDYHRQFKVPIKVARIFNTYGPRMHPMTAASFRISSARHFR